MGRPAVRGLCPRMPSVLSEADLSAWGEQQVRDTHHPVSSGRDAQESRVNDTRNTANTQHGYYYGAFRNA